MSPVEEIVEGVYLIGGPNVSYGEDATAFVIRFPETLVMIDSGAGRSASVLEKNMAKAGLKPGDISLLVLTHCHIDHIGGAPYFREIHGIPTAMHDLDAVREALGYERINLYGASYGTRAALTYLRLFPDRVRSVVLDAAVSPDYRLFLNTAQDADRALDSLFDRCEADAACKEAFPDAREGFAALLARLEVEPLTATIPDPVSADPITVTLERADLLNLTFPLLYTPEIAALLPLNLQQASAGNPAPLLAQAGAMDAGLYLGMFYAVACTEDAPFLDPAKAAALAEDTLFGDRTEMLREICTAWPQGDLSPGWDAPVVSDAPALLLSGEADPVTPPHYAVRVAETLPNSLHVVGPGMGHGLMGRGCIDTLVADFIDAASVTDLDAACAQDLAPPPFFISPTGPRP